MSKVTFVVEFEDGKEPAVNAGMTIFGGKLAAVSWSDALEEKVFSVHECLPSPNDTVLLFDSTGEGWLIGWRSMWMTFGQKETGSWQWTFQNGDIDIDDVVITHWAPIPEEPEAAQ
ncbi:hypothetical protein WP3S18E09_12400 [Escherichia coli]|nr:DUF551 domain-containing protein [Escherichia coli]TYF59875.1 hypothetical protein DJ490_07955 [Enterobacter hormaechei]MBB9833812.1 DUF551 domain-containing protein [Escherichia coli]BBR34227.1 hypothetical protein WP3S18E09_12400 [Escherichia coli]HAL5923681.1 DUF551 domain-containing protein [Escherichia coli]